MYKNVEIDETMNGISYSSSIFKRDIAAGSMLTSYDPLVDNKPLASWNIASPKDGTETPSFLKHGIVKDGKYISYNDD
jgi:hypothetical protein